MVKKQSNSEMHGLNYPHRQDKNLTEGKKKN